MEMEFRDDRWRRRITIFVGLLLAVTAGVSAFFLITQAQQQAGRAGLATVPIVVAARDIPARKAIEAGDLAVRQVPVDGTNAAGVFNDPTPVIGLVPSVAILQGQPVFANLLAASSGGGHFSIVGPGESLAPNGDVWRAVSLTVPDDRAVGGMVEAGDTVDVFVTLDMELPVSLVDAGRYYSDKSTKITYQNVPILAKAGTSYVVKVPGLVAEEVNHLQASGAAAFSLALRPLSDTRLVDAGAAGATTTSIIARYGLPLPQVYPPGRGPIPTPEPTAPPAGAEPSPEASAAP
jgi:Flp pilus assembly protein CpaB